jgi:DNA-binding GntR family transcriptional regulator
VIDLAKEFTNSICKQVREMILRGEILMVARIVEIGLAENLGVSRTSVREVLRLLTSECLVSFMPNRGYVVISYFSEDVTQIYSCRAWLESEAVRLVTLNSVAGDMRRRLESLVKKAHEGFADRSSAKAVRERFLINNNEFLERLHAGCSNVPLLK